MNPQTAETRAVPFGSAEHDQLIALRDAVLRRPLGLALSSADLQAERDSFHLGCWCDGHLVACVVLKPLGAGRMRLRQMAVAEAFERRGFGAQMVREAEAFARQQGCDEFILHARQTAAGFYRKLGYVSEGEPFTEIGLPHVLMRRSLRGDA